MCFSQEMSGAFALMGLLVTVVAHLTFKNTRFSLGIFYFVLMEALQYFQYNYIDDGCSPMNQILTVVGFAHVCGQPFFTHLMCGAFYHRKGTRGVQNSFTLKLCAAAAVAFFMRYVLAKHIKPDSYIPLEVEGPHCVNTEWIRASSMTPGGADTACTFRGLHHLAWSVPMYQPTYFSPGTFIHSFMMFAPFWLTKGIQAKLFGTFLFLSGPVLSTFITPNLNEQASIWCFLSIAQISMMTLGVLLISRGGGTKKNGHSVHTNKKNGTAHVKSS